MEVFLKNPTPMRGALRLNATKGPGRRILNPTPGTTFFLIRFGFSFNKMQNRGIWLGLECGPPLAFSCHVRLPQKTGLNHSTPSPLR